MFERRAKRRVCGGPRRCNESERGLGTERDWRRGRQTVWFKEEGEEKETDLGLSLEGGERKKEETERKKN